MSKAPLRERKAPLRERQLEGPVAVNTAVNIAVNIVVTLQTRAQIPRVGELQLAQEKTLKIPRVFTWAKAQAFLSKLSSKKKK